MLPARVERYFETLFGFPERDYNTTKKLFLSACRLETRAGRERCVFTFPASSSVSSSSSTRGSDGGSGGGGPAFPQPLDSGWHYAPSVAELRQEVQQSLDRLEARHPGYLARVRAHFDVHPVPADLMLEGKKDGVVPPTQVGPLRLSHVLGVSSEQHLRYPGALFQAASQFNLLEFISPVVTPEAGIAEYVFDATQGPDCAVSCFPGTAYRNFLIHPEFVHDGELASYRADVLKGDAGNGEAGGGVAGSGKPRRPMTAEQLTERRGQRADWQVDTLQDITRFLTNPHGGKSGHADVPGVPYDAFYRIQNGYFRVDSQGQVEGLIPRLATLASFHETSVAALLDRMSDLLRIGVVEDATVTCGLLQSMLDTDDGEDADNKAVPTVNPVLHTVWQTYNSALSLITQHRDEASAVPTLARCVLNGSYEATLLAGVLRTVRHLEEAAGDAPSGEAAVSARLPPVFLTKVGGGVFNNKASWISGAIDRAMGRVASLGVPLDLRLVHFRQLDRQYFPSGK